MFQRRRDKALVARAMRGDQAAFREFFDACFPRLYRFALARLDGDHDAATEVVQDTFCKAIRRLDSYRGDAALYTWMYRICGNALIDYCRKAQRSAEHLADTDQAQGLINNVKAPGASQPEAAAGRCEMRQVIQGVLDHMPERHAAALEMKYLESLSVREIAQRLGVGDKAAESLLTRARNSFRQAVEEVARLRNDPELPAFLRDSGRV